MKVKEATVLCRFTRNMASVFVCVSVCVDEVNIIMVSFYLFLDFLF